MKRSALVTGASEGIGYAFAARLAAEGYVVTGVARNEGNLKKLTGELGGEHSYIVADLTTTAGQDKIVKAISERHFDLLVNNAGIAATGKFAEIPLKRHLEVLTLNCEAVVTLSHAYLNSARAGDALINVSSALALMPMPLMGLYSATKAFVTSLSESLWYYQKKRGVYVMGLCPGITSTRFNEHSGAGSQETPKIMTQTPEELVDAAMKALKRRKKPTVISGAVNNVFAFISRVRSRRGVINMMGQMVE
ncbi:MAG: SDR family NAD(P)-dependent oxidoreductase [Nitrospinae bacterium]|nr:SDR family NAD(P)-dependent oxidoreductase [Nitrospinota bacterium]